MKFQITTRALSALLVLSSLASSSAAKVEQEQKKGAPKYPLHKPSEDNLLSSAQVLGNGTHWTIVPKTSVLTVPERLKSKLLSAPKGKFVGWKTFLSSNPAWLGTEKVDLATSSGSSEIDYERFATISKRGKITIAVHNGSPVSVEPKAVIKTPPSDSK